MEKLRRYRKRADRPVVAVRLDLETDGFTYTKWGGEQRCKRGDWLVDNDGEIYTIDNDVFDRTYRRIAPGQYVKTNRVWARVATEAGRIKTKEGLSAYQPGDYLVYNDAKGEDGYCMSPEKFAGMYEEDA
jgi:hypothetical protein